MTRLALLIDRDAETRQAYAESLRRAAYEIEEAADGREGLAKALSCNPAVVVTEAQLPGMSGLELCRLLRHDQSTRSISIVVLAAEDGEHDITLAQAAGADTVLVKPCHPERLLTEIRALLSQTQPVVDRSREQVVSNFAQSRQSIEHSRTNGRRVAKSRAHDRGATSYPPILPPALRCPTCDRTVRYLISQIGGVSERHTEQWDYFECAACRSTFEYRQRTRKLRPYSLDVPGSRRSA